MSQVVDVSKAPAHLLGEMLRAHKKVVTADTRLHRGRKHRVIGHWGPIDIRRTKWHTTSRKWQKRYTLFSWRVDAHLAAGGA